MSPGATSSPNTMLSAEDLPSSVFCSSKHLCAHYITDEACGTPSPQSLLASTARWLLKAIWGTQCSVLGPSFSPSLPSPNPRKGWENKGSHVLNILCHSIQVYHSFPLSLPWPQRWGNDLICLPTHREFLGRLGFFLP